MFKKIISLICASWHKYLLLTVVTIVIFSKVVVVLNPQPLESSEQLEFKLYDNDQDGLEERNAILASNNVNLEQDWHVGMIVEKSESAQLLRRNFVGDIVGMAVVEMQTFGVPASITIAQAILESGSGESSLSREANNLFGIKANKKWLDDKRPVFKAKTLEYYDGNNYPTEIVDLFKAYKDLQSSFTDHSLLLTQTKTYSRLNGITDYVEYANTLKACGYATDPQYSSKLIRLIEKYKLYLLDNQNSN